MRKRIWLTTLLFAVLAAGTMYLVRPKQPAPVSAGVTGTQNRASAVAAHPSSPRLLGTQTAQLTQSNRQFTSSAPSTEVNASSAHQEWLQQVQPGIVFYGKAVDENDQPVLGANVEFAWTQVQGEADFKTSTSSGADGLFSLAGVNGSALDVYVTKPGYYPVRSLNRKNFSYMALPGCQPFQPDQRYPVVFHLRKKGAGADLITSRNGISPGLDISGLANGSPVKVDLFNRKVAADGELELSAVKPPHGQPATKWSFRMSIPTGGFVEENDEFPFEAPQSGYKPVLEFEFRTAETNWTENLHKRYYIVFGEPPKYGWIDVQTGIYRGVSLRYAINPDGSRYLEPK